MALVTFVSMIYYEYLLKPETFSKVNLAARFIGLESQCHVSFTQLNAKARPMHLSIVHGEKGKNNAASHTISLV